MSRAPKTAEAYGRLLATLARIQTDYVESAERDFDELETLEAYMYAIQMVGHVSEFLVEADRERPRFSLIVSPGPQDPRRQPRLDLPPGRDPR